MDAETLQFHAVLSQHATRAEAALEGLLPAVTPRSGAAMRHAVLARRQAAAAFLAMEAAAMFRVPPGQASDGGGGERIDAYSLVHDDLPCMDDDDLRRASPTVHVKWDEATAVLAGDALQTLAFEVLAAPQGGIEPRLPGAAAAAARAGGGRAGMVGGQAFDLAAETAPAPLDLAAISDLQALKTGALRRLGGGVGWRSVGRSTPARCGRYAAALALAFRIGDDILDVEGDCRGGAASGCARTRRAARPPSRLGSRGRGAARTLVGGASRVWRRRLGGRGNVRAAAQFFAADGADAVRRRDRR